ncbi:LINE-1 reverse transcriptase like [Trifolium medium]|uniref:LINE-1 reverse transcriptase like n=1 Tax=Trifolium medium TaxID=97028 RepID=A0A392MBV7_9FABA|nr:LINE-1 reverse transcriptase like [Trifolium medium]
MKACVCQGNLSVLVKGCPTEQINISRGLKQGDPLAWFLFLLVVEGLTMLSNNPVSLGFFKGFQVSSDVSVSLLQCADDTLFIGDACVENLWSMKAILRCGRSIFSTLQVGITSFHLLRAPGGVKPVTTFDLGSGGEDY